VGLEKIIDWPCAQGHIARKMAEKGLDLRFPELYLSDLSLRVLDKMNPGQRREPGKKGCVGG
jgi:hypothetical protein